MVSADLLREARLRAGLTQTELARRVGKPPSVISRWERGVVQPSLETLRSLIRACGLELTFRLATYDDSYVPFIERYLDASPADRLRSAVDRAETFARLRSAVEGARRG